MKFGFFRHLPFYEKIIKSLKAEDFSGEKTLLRKIEVNLLGWKNYLAGLHPILDPFEKLLFSFRPFF